MSPAFRRPEALRNGAALAAVVAATALAILWPGSAWAHGVSDRDAIFVQSIDGPAIGPFLYLGAKHMVTGYDHLLFLVGVIFFLYRLRDVVQYVSLFTLGHSLTLLGGVLGDIRANAYIVDAIIGLSVVYKAFENMGGFERLMGWRPNTKLAVMVFGLFHGFGLATKIQELTVSANGLVTNIVSFNVGVEIGQVLALTGVLLAITFWRTRPGFLRHSFAANTVLMVGGFILMGYQIAGYLQ
jgi:hypothetical protein